jgi:hypothetical protein
MSFNLHEQVQQWRSKAREGTLTREEMRAAVDAIRVSRKGAGEVSAKAKTAKTTKAKAANIDSDDLLKGLE